MIELGGVGTVDDRGQIDVLEDHQDLKSRREAALERCGEMIAWYQAKRRKMNLAFNALQGLVIVLTGMMPFLVLFDRVDDKLVQAAPATILTIAIALMGSYKLRENWVRYTVAVEALRSEQAKYLTRTTPSYWRVPREEALNNFVERIEALALSEVEEWRKQMVQHVDDPKVAPRAAV
jgi:hypothetical protein